MECTHRDTLWNDGVDQCRKQSNATVHLRAKSRLYVRTAEVCPKHLRSDMSRTSVMREYEWLFVETSDMA